MIPSIFQRPQFTRPVAPSVATANTERVVRTEAELQGALLDLPAEVDAAAIMRCQGKTIVIAAPIVMRAPIRLGNRHSGLTIRGSSPAVVLSRSASNTDAMFIFTSGTDGAVRNVTVRDLELGANIWNGFSVTNSSFCRIDNINSTPSTITIGGTFITGTCDDTTVDGCTVGCGTQFINLDGSRNIISNNRLLEKGDGRWIRMVGTGNLITCNHLAGSGSIINTEDSSGHNVILGNLQVDTMLQHPSDQVIGNSGWS